MPKIIDATLLINGLNQRRRNNKKALVTYRRKKDHARIAEHLAYETAIESAIDLAAALTKHIPSKRGR